MSAPESRWRHLLALALPALDHVFGPETDETRPPPWTLGGGTAIAVWIDHRISFDVDLFIAGVPLKRFTPRHNPGAAAISRTYQWPGHDLKFERPEGEIDFLSAPLQTEPGYAWTDLEGRRIAVETPEEVLVKKIRFRSARFTARDVFDLAAVAKLSPELPGILAREVPDALARTLEALDFQAARGTTALARSVIPTAWTRNLAGEAFALGRGALERAAALAADGPA
ncbi:nucleotidyl transferase AbiEii/AbiGii toxin family protein [Methylobacterium sp. A54F]